MRGGMPAVRAAGDQMCDQVARCIGSSRFVVNSSSAVRRSGLRGSVSSSILFGDGEALETLAESLADQIGQLDRAGRGPRLGRTEIRLAPIHADQLLTDVDLAAVEVDLIEFEAEDLTTT